jgi:hypothetical protein
MPSVVSSNILLFADDAKIWRTLKSEEDFHILQDDLNKLHLWTQRNHLSFNETKCKVLSLRHPRKFAYHIGSYSLPHVKSENDLGITIQNDLGCSINAQKASSKALRHLGLLKRIFGAFDPTIFPQLFKTFVRPHTEYVSQVCQPWLKRDLIALEYPQRRATKMVRGLYTLSYEQRLQQLQLYSAAYRRIRGDLILTYHIMNEAEHPLKILLELASTRQLRGHCFKLVHQFSRLECRRNFFSIRICERWNTLPNTVIEANSVTIFKKRLDNFLRKLHFTYP